MRPNHEQKAHFDSLAAEFMTRLDGSVPHRDLIERMLASVLRMSGDDRRADLKITAAALEEMEHSFDVLEMFYQRRKVSIFGSARSAPASPVYEQARDFAEAIVERGFMVITGAGPGVMAAGNEGAGREHSFGMGILLPREGASNTHIRGDLKDIAFKYFFTRKLAFLKDCHGVVLCPGGFGTHDEGFETLTLIQTGKAQLLPVVCLAPEGNSIWHDWHRYNCETLLAQGMISDEDLSLYKVTHSIEEACDEICRFYRRYHSLRFCGPELFVRLTRAVDPQELEVLNTDFADLAEGPIEACSAPSGEAYDPTLENLPSIRFRFTNGNYGRLRQMIDFLNDCRPEECADIPPERGEGGRMPAETD